MEKKTFLVSPATMPAVLHASRNGISRKNLEIVRKRCKAQQAARAGPRPPSGRQEETPSAGDIRAEAACIAD